MRLTAELVKRFEGEQKIYGTLVALYNLFWLKAADDLKDIGVTRLSTRTEKGHRGRRREAA